MACGGCGQKKKYTPIRTIPQSLPPPVVQPKPYAPQKMRTPMPPSNVARPINPKLKGKFCDKCGWVVSLIRYTDPVTGVLIERKSCTNRRCTGYGNLQ